MTAGKDGVLVAWNIGFSEQRKLIHAVVKTVDLPREQTGGGHPVSLYYLAPFGPADSIAVGLSSNSILEVKVNSSELCLLITAHSGVLEAVAEHPFKPFYVTAGREKMVRGEFIYLEILVVNQCEFCFFVIFLFTFFFFLISSFLFYFIFKSLGCICTWIIMSCTYTCTRFMCSMVTGWYYPCHWYNTR